MNCEILYEFVFTIIIRTMIIDIFLYGTLHEFDSFRFLMKYTQTKEKRFVIIILTSA